MSGTNLENWANSKTAAGANSTSGHVPTSDGSGGIAWSAQSGGGGGGIALNWAFSTTTADADPGANTFRMNNATPASVTELYVDDITNSGVDASTVLESLNAGDKLYIQQLDTAANFILLTVVSVTDATGYYRIVVTVDDSGTLFGNTEDCGFILQYAAANAATGINNDVACKGWVNFTADSPFGINSSFNVASVDDNGTGSYDVNWDIDFDDADYTVNINCQDSIGTSTHGQVDNATPPTVGTVRIGTVRTENAVSIDPDNVFVTAYGNMSNLSTGGNTFAVNKSSLCKGWVTYTSVTTTVIADSFNVDSLDDNGTGDTTINWDQNFDNTGYAVTSTSNHNITYNNGVHSTSQHSVQTITHAGSPVDTDIVCVMAFGDNSVTGLTGDASFDATKLEGRTIDAGLTVGEPGYFDGTDYKQSTGKATFPDGLKDGTSGQLVESGLATGLSGLTAGTYYWLASAGGLTTDSTETAIRIGRAESTTTLIVNIQDLSASGVNPDAACKGWLQMDSSSGTPVATGSFNVDSFDDNGVGDTTVNWTIPFDNNDYSVTGMVNTRTLQIISITAAAVRVQTRDSTDNVVDSTLQCITAFGDNQVTVGGTAPGVKNDALCKGHINFDGTGTISIRGSFNVDTIDDNGVGTYDINWAIPFDDANYSYNITSEGAIAHDGGPGGSVGTATVLTADSSNTAQDHSRIYVQAFGNNPVALSTEPSSDSLCKGWVSYNTVTTTTINDSFNVDSVDDNGTGDSTVNWLVDFADTNYSVSVGYEPDNVLAAGANKGREAWLLNKLAGSIDVRTALYGVSADRSLIDFPEVNLQAFGDR